MHDERERLRSRFSEAAELYDRARPGYPPHLIEDLIRIAGLRRESRVLEVGPGTGQLTTSLAERGFEIVAVELGRDLAELAAKKLVRFANVTVHAAQFEDWRLPSEPFDVVVAATAFHWIDPDVRYSKAAKALKDEGRLAIVTTHHVVGGTEDFFQRVQLCYEEHMPETPPGLELPGAGQVESGDRLLDASGLFQEPVVRRYLWETSYTTTEYLDVLMTYSGHRDLDERQRRNLLYCIKDLIDSSYGGSIRKAYMNKLIVATKR